MKYNKRFAKRCISIILIMICFSSMFITSYAVENEDALTELDKVPSPQKAPVQELEIGQDTTQHDRGHDFLDVYSFTPVKSGNYTFSGYGYMMQLEFRVFRETEEIGVHYSRWTTIVNYDHYLHYYLEEGYTYYIEVQPILSRGGTLYNMNLNFDSQTIGLDTPVRVEIDEKNQKKYYRFTPTEPGTYTFTTSDRLVTGGGWILDGGSIGQTPNWIPAPMYITAPVGELYDSGLMLEDPVLTERYVTGPFGTTDLAISYNLVAGQTYYFEAGCVSTGAYTLTLSRNPIDISDKILTGEGLTVEITEPDQMRYFTFVPETTNQYTFTSSNYGENTPRLTLYNSEEEILSSGDFTITAPLTAGETYYIISGLADQATGSFDLNVTLTYKPWTANTSYEMGQIITYGTAEDGTPKHYMILQAHDGMAHWLPGSTPSLYKLITAPYWSQPISSIDAYSAGDRVLHNGRAWISQIDGNVWAPGVYGWQVEET